MMHNSPKQPREKWHLWQFRWLLYSLCKVNFQSQGIQTVPISSANISQHAEQTADWHEQSHAVWDNYLP